MPSTYLVDLQAKVKNEDVIRVDVCLQKVDFLDANILLQKQVDSFLLWTVSKHDISAKGKMFPSPYITGIKGVTHSNLNQLLLTFNTKL